jgi:TFIIF-interacting CTD phosphatase-like protein
VVFAKTLVLDLDETLVYADAELPRPAEFQVGPYGVLRRPGVEEFLEFALSHFEQVGVWTASTLGYALPVLDHLVDRQRLAFVWGRERCTLRIDYESRDGEWLKDIRKLTKRGKCHKERLLFVDDTPAKLARSYGNLIAIRPFQGDPADRELQLLELYLRSIGDVDNVRTLEKRCWREQVSEPSDRTV